MWGSKVKRDPYSSLSPEDMRRILDEAKRKAEIAYDVWYNSPEQVERRQILEQHRDRSLSKLIVTPPRKYQTTS